MPVFRDSKYDFFTSKFQIGWHLLTVIFAEDGNFKN